MNIGASPNAWLYAVRLVGQTGWMLDDSELAPARYEEAVHQAGFAIAAIETVCKFVTIKSIGPPGRFDVVCARWGQWTYDPVAACWRAPDEPMTLPADDPLMVPALKVILEPSEDGWMPATIGAGSMHVAFDISEVFDPFPDMIAWLEKLVEGRSARLTIDIEGIQLLLHVVETENPARVRFRVDWDRRDLGAGIVPSDIDIVIERASLIGAFHRALIRFSEDEMMVREWASWVGPYVDDPAGEPRLPYSLISERVDHHLRGEAG